MTVIVQSGDFDSPAPDGSKGLVEEGFCTGGAAGLAGFGVGVAGEDGDAGAALYADKIPEEIEGADVIELEVDDEERGGTRADVGEGFGEGGGGEANAGQSFESEGEYLTERSLRRGGRGREAEP